jgi:hypothetical protein
MSIQRSLGRRGGGEKGNRRRRRHKQQLLPGVLSFSHLFLRLLPSLHLSPSPYHPSVSASPERRDHVRLSSLSNRASSFLLASSTHPLLFSLSLSPSFAVFAYSENKEQLRNECV